MATEKKILLYYKGNGLMCRRINQVSILSNTRTKDQGDELGNITAAFLEAFIFEEMCVELPFFEFCEDSRTWSLHPLLSAHTERLLQYNNSYY